MTGMEACRCSADQDRTGCGIFLPEMVALGAWVIQEVRFANLGYFFAPSSAGDSAVALARSSPFVCHG
jgi:hypothetical protein